MYVLKIKSIVISYYIFIKHAEEKDFDDSVFSHKAPGWFKSLK